MGPWHVLKLLFSDNYKIENYFANTEAIEENVNRFGTLKNLDFFICFTKFKVNQILLNQSRHKFSVPMKL
jgi:hypothetical protein